jgi:hypothetical protein
MATNGNGANVENDRWKATTTKNDEKKKRYRLTTMMPGRVRDPSTWRTGLNAPINKYEPICVDEYGSDGNNSVLNPE